MKLIRWIGGFFDSTQPQSMTWLCAFLLTVAIVVTVTVRPYTVWTAAIVGALGTVIGILLRHGWDTRPTGGQ